MLRSFNQTVEVVDRTSESTYHPLQENLVCSINLSHPFLPRTHHFTLKLLFHLGSA